MCNYSVNIDYYYNVFVNESRIITLYFFSFLVKLNFVIWIIVGNMPIFNILKGQNFEGGGVKENAIIL
jgi:hypothetical protein